MCDTVVVVGADGVLFAKNSDRDPNEAQVLEWHPAAEHAAGGRLRCTWVEVEQARRTHAVVISRPFWMWGAEMGVNEHGVAIGNEAVFTRAPYAASGLTGMDLVRLGLERGASARAAVDVIVELLERTGQGGGCGHEDRSFTYHNSFLVADPKEAFVLETAGREWASERVAAGVRSISNGLTIPGFAERLSDPVRTRVSACRARAATTAAAATRDPSVAGLIAGLRAHGVDTGADGGDAGARGGDGGAAAGQAATQIWEPPAYHLGNGAMAAPCMHAGGLVAASQTTSSWVSELRTGDSRHWATGTSAPCLSIFKPVAVGEPVEVGAALARDVYDPAVLWWRGELLHRAVMRCGRAPSFLEERDAVERSWLTGRHVPAGTLAEADALLARWTAGALADAAGAGERDRRPWFVRRYWETRDRRAGMPWAVTRRPLIAGRAQA